MHHLTKILQVFVEDHGSFPPSLEVLLAQEKLDAGFLEPIHGERWEYTRPPENADGSTPVLRVTARSYEIVVFKSFKREVH